jgi:hypothetical protein
MRHGAEAFGKKSQLTLSVSGPTARWAVGLFAVLCAANSFFEWSFPAWFSLWGSPSGLLTPMVDKWVITPLAMVVYVLQYPSYAVLYGAPWLSNVKPPLSVILASVLSMVVYLPLTLWIRQHARRRAA